LNQAILLRLKSRNILFGDPATGLRITNAPRLLAVFFWAHDQCTLARRHVPMKSSTSLRDILAAAND
jgi:hypothetical protein